MEISNVIKQRILAKNKRYHCNDNISEFIEEGELDLLQTEVEGKLQEVLNSLVIDTKNDHNTNDTARRVAKMYIKEIFGGRFQPTPRITSFPNMGYKSLYTSGPISIRSTCAHHFQNIVGKAWIGIIPEDEVIGLSKFNRLVHHIAERPQIQEEMTEQIADMIEKETEAKGVAVVVKAEHFCMTARGVKEHETDMLTSVVRGIFRDEAPIKAEFFSLLSNMKGMK